MRAVRIGALIGLVAATSTALAMPAFFTAVKDNYKIKAGSNIDKAGCTLCHASKTDFKHFNAYGQDLKKLMADAKSTKLTADIIKKADDLDSNKDGVKNGAHFKADTLPGDVKAKADAPADKPAEKPAEK